MSDSSYSEEISSGHEAPGDVHNISFASLRSFGSQVSMESPSSVPPSPGPKTFCSQEFQMINLKPVKLDKRKSRIFGATKRKNPSKARASKKSKITYKGPEALPVYVPEPVVGCLPVVFPDSQLDPTHSNILLNLNRFQEVLDSMAQCTRCQEGKLQLLPSEIFAGSATKLSLKCNKCEYQTKFWSVSGAFRSKLILEQDSIPKRNETVYASVLAGRLIGVGCKRLRLYHSLLNIPGPMSSRTFSIAQANALIAAEEVARESMDLAKEELRIILNTPSTSKYVATVGSYDGAYQQRSGKSGGGFSRYCFAAAILVDTGKVVAYDVACNSCNICSMLANKLQRNQYTKEEYESQIEIHRNLCPAEYSDLSSVHLESALAPKVITMAMQRGVRFTAIVSDGDNKTHDVLVKSGIYSHLDGSPTIERFECLAHVAKRMKTNLHKKQEKVLKLVRAHKDFLSREEAKKGIKKENFQEIGSFIQGQNSTYKFIERELGVVKGKGDNNSIFILLRANSFLLSPRSTKTPW